MNTFQEERGVVFLLVVLLGPGLLSASAESEWRYEGVLDVPASASLCYWAPFEFEDLHGIDWYLALESDSEKSCLLGAHPDANSSLWQISPDGDLWLKRQGRFVATVEESSQGTWGVTNRIPMPDAIDNPDGVILWGHDGQLTLLANGVLWNSKIGGTWRQVDAPTMNLSGFVERGFVQTQSYIYYWGKQAGLLIHKRTGRIQRFLNDNWPELLKEFEQLGTTWSIQGDEVSVRNAENELLFNLDQKSFLTDDLLFQGMDMEGENLLSRINQVVPDSRWLHFLHDLRSGVGLIWFFLGLMVGAFGLHLARVFSAKPATQSDANASTSDLSELSELQLSGLSNEFQALVLVSPGVLSTEEFDQAIGNDHDQSPESQRSKRSKIIRDVNNEALLVIGYELVERDRDQIDRRKVIYRIKSVPVRLSRRIERQRNGRPNFSLER